jgi:hypothetical protein
MPEPSEFQIQRAVCIHLEKHAPADMEWWHTPNGEKRDAFTAKRLKDIGVKAGIPDLVFLRGGRLFGLELKAPGHKPSDAQNDRRARLLAAGIAAWEWTDSLAGALAFLHQHGLTTANR